jgi:copper resistance protein D
MCRNQVNAGNISACKESAVQATQRFVPPEIYRWKSAILMFVLLVFVFAPFARSQQQDDMDHMPGMNMSSPAGVEDPAKAAKRLADKQESEFNHRLAGILVVLAGIFILGQDQLAKRWPLARYAWPMCFLAAGLYLLIFSDTEMWPIGPQSPWYAITHNVEDLQHKTFAILLLALGYVELQRSRGRWTAAWTAWFFPVAAAAGAILLLFHVHGGDMQAPHAMQAMEKIQSEHRLFAATGFGVALTKGLAETPQSWQRFFRKVWPVLLIVLGALLTQYSE